MLQPFGDPDGSRGPVEEHEEQFITLPRQYGAIARPVNETTRTRVFAGAQGAGKTLYLRRLQNYLSHDLSIYTSRPVLTAEALPTELVVRISQMYPQSANSEMWKRLWNRSILLSTATHALRDAETYGSADEDEISTLREAVARFLPERKGTRQILEVAGQLCSRARSRRHFDELLGTDTWSDFRENLHEVLRNGRPIYLFVDAIDDNFRWAPAYWLTCQRGLFYAIMDIQRTDVEAGRVHVIISIRDLVLSSVARSEHGSRYVSPEYIVALDWDWRSITDFFRAKLNKLPMDAFTAESGARTPQAFFGRQLIWNEARQINEPIEQYLLRHTRLNPRDVIIMGNSVAELAARGKGISAVSDAKLRQRISQTASRLAHQAISQAANHILTDVMPWTASRQEFVEPYLTVDEYQAGELTREVLSILNRAETERFDYRRLTELEAEAERRFGVGAHLADVLWQNRLLGYCEGSTAHFYKGASDVEITVPRDASAYVLNPIVLDLLPAVDSVKGTVCFPGTGAT